MKLMEIRAFESKTVKAVLINPKQIETMEESDGMSRIVTASGRAIHTEEPLINLYTMWMMAQCVEMELAYNAGAANMKAQIERMAQERAQAEGQSGGEDGA